MIFYSNYQTDFSLQFDVVRKDQNLLMLYCSIIITKNKTLLLATDCENKYGKDSHGAELKQE